MGLSVGELALARHPTADAALREPILGHDRQLAQTPDHVGTHNNKGTALMRLGELRAALSDHAGAETAYADAIAADGEALTRAPDYVDAHINRGVTLSKIGGLYRTRGARTLLDRALTLAPNDNQSAARLA
jgi:tetratricopeptide (TPR) repeat protein